MFSIYQAYRIARAEGLPARQFRSEIVESWKAAAQRHASEEQFRGWMQDVAVESIGESYDARRMA